jgi:hypothetical protein
MNDLKNTAKNTFKTFPGPAQFRQWLSASLSALGLSASSYGPEIDLGKNTIGHFMGGADRDLRLGTAVKIHDDLNARAIVAGVSLPNLGEVVANV